MEVSNKKPESSGQDLIETLVSLTGLPESWVSQELVQILENSGKCAKSITLEQLRDAMLIYLESVQTDLLTEYDSVID